MAVTLQMTRVNLGDLINKIVFVLYFVFIDGTIKYWSILEVYQLHSTLMV
jgi:hypothetical protein